MREYTHAVRGTVKCGNEAACRRGRRPERCSHRSMAVVDDFAPGEAFFRCRRSREHRHENLPATRSDIKQNLRCSTCKATGVLLYGESRIRWRPSPK